MTTYRVWLGGEETIDVSAESFQIQDGGTLVFFDDDDGELTTGPDPFAAYNKWNSVMEV